MMYDVLRVVRRARVHGSFPRHPKVRVYNNNIITVGDHATGPRRVQTVADAMIMGLALL